MFQSKKKIPRLKTLFSRPIPEALIINGEFDVLRDEGEAYAQAKTPAALGAINIACQFIKERIVD